MQKIGNKLINLILFINCVLVIPGSVDAQDQVSRKISIALENVTLQEALTEVQKQSGLRFIYNEDFNKYAGKKIDLRLQNAAAMEVIDQLLKGTRLGYEEMDGHFLISEKKNRLTAVPPQKTAPQADGILSGQVKDAETNQPLGGVSIKILELERSVSTDSQGNYQIGHIPEGTYTIIVNHLSYKNFRQQVKIAKGVVTLPVSLLPATNDLDEVIVIGYGTQKKSDLTGSIASIKGDDIRNLPVRSIAEALQGRASGVMVNKSSGLPGSASQVIIRGPGSINGLNPLFVIDGIPKGNSVNYDVGDVESIEVIKDASAAAIYGAQAAGGVVLITTRKGALNQDLGIDVSSHAGQRQISKSYEMLGTPDYIRARRGIGENYALWDNPDLPSTNWFDEVYKTGDEESMLLSLNGGSEKTNFYVSAGYEREKGLVLNNFWERYSLRANAEYHLSKRFSVGHQLYLMKIGQNTSARDIPWRTIPYMAVYNDDGTFASVPPEVEFSGTNDVGYLNYTHRKEGSLMVDATLFTNYNILDGLNLRITGSGVLGSNFYDNFFEDNKLARTPMAATYTKTSGQDESYVFNAVLTYKKLFAGQHDLGVMAGYEVKSSFNTGLSAIATDFPVKVAESFGLSTNPDKIASGSLSYGRFLSQFGRITYAFKDRYLFTGNIRRDGSPKFGESNRWGVFPSLAVGWKLSDEPFFKNISQSWISQLKPRLSWGILGNDAAINNFAYKPSYQVVGQHSFEGTISGGFNSIKVINKDIKWEEIETLNAGLDIGLLNNSLQINADYYSRQTKDMLYNLPTPPSSGIAPYYQATSSMPVNIGKISNKGWELNIAYSRQVRDFSYRLSGNLSSNKNKVIDLGLPLAYIYSGSLTLMTGSSPAKTENGQPVGMLYGLIADGLISSKEEMDALNQKATEAALADGSIQPGQVAYYNNINTGPGDLKYRDLNGDGKINDADRTFIGNPWPKLNYGFSIGLGWKGLDLSVDAMGAFDRDVMNGSTAFEQSFKQDYQTTADIFNASFFLGNGLTSQPRLGVQDPNSNGFIKDPSNNYSWYSSYFVQDASFLKLKNITVGYTLPQKTLQAIGIKKFRVYFSGENLVTFTKFSGLDPEFSNDVKSFGLYGTSTYPQTKLYSAGIDLSF